MSSPAQTIDQLPVPKALPVIGNLHKLTDPTQMHLTLAAWARELGSMYRVRLGPWRTLVIVSDPGLVNDILKERPHTFRRWSHQERILTEVFGVQDPENDNGLFLAEGESWRLQRRMAMGALNSNHLQRYFSSIRTSGLRLHARLEASAGREVGTDIVDALYSFAVDVTSGLVFGQDLNTLERGENELGRHFGVLMEETIQRFLAPVPYWRLPIRLPRVRKAAASAEALDAAVVRFIAEGRARVAARPELLEAPENLLDAMIAAQRSDGVLTDEQLKTGVISLLVAGEDTTAHTLGWAVWLLAGRPEVQRRLADEARAAFGDEPFPADHGTIDSLEYAEAVMREALRLYAVAPMLAVEALTDTTVGGTTIPKGTALGVMLREAARGHGGDAAEFRPERWIDDGPTPPKTLAFGSGPRFCPGRNLAMIEVKAALAMIAKDFEISLDPHAPPVREELTLTVAPAGLQVRLKRRVAVAA